MTCQLSKAVFGDKIGTAAWHEEPSFYLLTKDDHALAHEVQQRFAKQINAKAKTLQRASLNDCKAKGAGKLAH